MSLQKLQQEIEALPRSLHADAPSEPAATPLEIVGRQGRMIVKLCAAAESLETRYREMAATLQESERRHEEQEQRLRAAETRARKIAQETVRLLDLLEWTQESARARGADPLAQDIASARRDTVRRLAAVGITEIPAEGQIDGRLHESIDTQTTNATPPYHIVSVVRRGYQFGLDILRRAEVITAA